MSHSPGENRVQLPRGIDPRAPRFAAWITAVLLLIGTFLALLGPGVATLATVAERLTDPGFIVLVVVDALFVWGFTSPRTAPWGVLYRSVIRPRLAPPEELEDPRPPRFAQVVGFTVVTVGLALYLLGVAWALPIAGAAAFVAAFLNAAFGLCLGCQLYLAFARIGLIRPRGGLVGI
ncbi:hypothetical protein FHX49_000720 [Microbacterium endophyticum]|uniref:DUF4395 domain-containing protein n=1 Tax=Microbacterium endophyticum TaxID=1526412 RepID=A0A7W4V1U5_9MICO|nr:DUF4395 domain-containing protein [Microbacterium endophyticum]MBB2975179.1 hypothetical protein [Microbacterium endophyticum]NIK37609.1 hypothetical protein [Microbacterium endophyticum]